ncbi:MAG: hypothetical protein CSB55_06045 [Candidatus Cloacimonadota bacterium]|nr:MAG: hypothetical protein CSB55_06045 [Candidatus Cloacimonadota bacterium]
MKNCILIFCLIFPLFLRGFSVNENFSAVPSGGYSEETGMMIGGVIVYSGEREFAGYAPSSKNAVFQVLYSFKKQITSNIIFSGTLKSLNIFDRVKLKLKKWPEDFYGFGNSSPEKNIEKFTLGEAELRNEAVRYLNGEFKISLINSFDFVKLRNLEDDGILINLSEKQKSYFNVGFGSGVEYDTRDDAYYPVSGVLLKLNWINFSKDLLSDFGYDEYLADFRYYMPFGKRTLLGSQFMINLKTGSVPFSQLSKLGKEMRGYRSMQFIDKGMLLYRTEFRSFPFYAEALRKYGFVVFVETGQVYDKLINISENKMHFSYGAGFRFKLVKNEDINLRADFALGDKGLNFSISAREVF